MSQLKNSELMEGWHGDVVCRHVHVAPPSLLGGVLADAKNPDTPKQTWGCHHGDKQRRHATLVIIVGAAILCVGVGALNPPPSRAADELLEASQDSGPGVVQCANLIYGQDKSSVCFAEEFLALLQRDTSIRTNRRFYAVKSDSVELYQYPFAIMTGEGPFTLTAAQRNNLRNYLQRGGFLLASPGCSSSQWDASFRAEVQAIFPNMELKRIPMSHPIFHTVYDINRLDTTHSGGDAYLEGLEIGGKIVLIYSHEGLNDTANSGPGCCCCGGNEIQNSRQINANLLAYALTH